MTPADGEAAFVVLVYASVVAADELGGPITYGELADGIRCRLAEVPHEGPECTPERYAAAVDRLAAEGMLSRLGDGGAGDVLTLGANHPRDVHR